MNQYFINPENYLKALQKLDNKKTPFSQMGREDFGFYFEEIYPPEGYEPPLDFPNCCNFHIQAYEKAESYFQKFPDCCTPHRKLIGKKWFNKDDYRDLTKKFINQLSYTEHYIKTHIESENWYKNITDYIEVNMESFGQFPLGYGNPVGLELYI